MTLKDIRYTDRVGLIGPILLSTAFFWVCSSCDTRKAESIKQEQEQAAHAQLQAQLSLAKTRRADREYKLAKETKKGRPKKDGTGATNSGSGKSRDRAARALMPCSN